MKKILELANGVLDKIPSPYTKTISSTVEVVKKILDNEELTKKIKATASQVKKGVNNFVDKNITHKTEIKKIVNENRELKTQNDELENMVMNNWKGIKKFDNPDDYLQEEIKIAQSLDSFYQNKNSSTHKESNEMISK